MTDETERRKHMRLPATYVIRYKPRYGKNTYEVTQTQNVSQGGIFLFTSKMFNEGDQLQMHIQFPFAKEKIMVIAEVITCKQSTKGSLYETRLKFIEMSEEIKQKLGEIIEHRKQQE